MESTQFSKVECFVTSFTAYSALSVASDEEFTTILTQLQAEWNFEGTLVCTSRFSILKQLTDYYIWMVGIAR